MKIITGKFRGRTLRAPDNARPTLARVRSSLFSMISEYIDNESIVLDLFAGSGSLGIEAISRGAKRVYFVDNDRQSIETLKYNLRGIESALYKINHSEYAESLRVFASANTKFDVVFIDPPYKTGMGESAVDMVFRMDLLSEDGILVFESPDNKLLQDFPTNSIMIKKKDYNSTKIYILKRKD